MNKLELEKSFVKHIAPLLQQGMTIRGISFDNQFWMVTAPTSTQNNVHIYINMFGAHEEDVRKAFTAYFKPTLDKGEGMKCVLKAYNQAIKLHLNFLNDPVDGFQHNPYLNQTAILALQVMREGCKVE